MIFVTAQTDVSTLNDWLPVSKDRIKDRSILVVGMARSGVAAARLLTHAGGRVFVSEVKPEDALREATARLRGDGIRYETGGHTPGAIEGVDFVVTSPGVPESNLLLSLARERSLPVFSELEVASWLAPAPILAVTGSNGKTTTTSWLGSIYEHARRPAQVGGNIGRAFAEFADRLTGEERAILEVSTFQLERIEEFRPHVGALLNLSPDHLDRHGTYEEYIRLKFRLFENQTVADTAVLNADDPLVVKWDREKPSGKARRWWFSARGPVRAGVWLDGAVLSWSDGKRSGTIPGSDRLIPPGTHNRMNAAAAVAMALADGLSPHEIEPGLTAFRGVEHRIEHVAEVRGVTYINDSKATNPDAVEKALQALDRPLVVILGGLDKNSDFTVLAPLLKERARALIFTGKAAPKLEVELGSQLPYRTADKFADAFDAAVEIAEPGDIVLLSPACASFDQFDNYEHRGRVFKSLVAALAERNTAS
ncbi:MAG: UDP-N-acetylmuramoyl-L-alanine--D-glutamate ligase [Candidatus Zixiibacteriota bacterium]